MRQRGKREEENVQQLTHLKRECPINGFHTNLKEWAAPTTRNPPNQQMENRPDTPTKNKD